MCCGLPTVLFSLSKPNNTLIILYTQRELKTKRIKEQKNVNFFTSYFFNLPMLFNWQPFICLVQIIFTIYRSRPIGLRGDYWWVKGFRGKITPGCAGRIYVLCMLPPKWIVQADPFRLAKILPAEWIQK